jgi:glycosyltransferase involved in cell wall biosynthesis
MSVSREIEQVRTLLFYRDYGAFSGGHLKVWHYYEHAAQSEIYKPQIYFSRKSVWDQTNPWLGEHANVLASWKPEKASALFVGGMDWLQLDRHILADKKVPIINLVQHVRHGSPTDPRYEFLKYKAIRLCVSQEVHDVLAATGVVNGPLVVQPNCLDLSHIPAIKNQNDRKIDLFIVGIKQKGMAQRLADDLRYRNIRIKVLTKPVERSVFLEYLADSKTTLLLPHQTEGFYLPALEGMAAGTVVVCPDCVGNRSFCLDGINCLRPLHLYSNIRIATERALTIDSVERKHLVDAGVRTSKQYDLGVERQNFLELLSNIEEIW